MSRPSPNILEDYVTRAELAQSLGMASERTLHRWEDQRQGPPVTRVGRKVLYYVPAVMLWLRSRELEMVRERRGRR